MRQVWIERYLVLLAGVCLFFVFVQIDAFALFVQLTREYETWHLDTFGSGLFAAAITLPFFMHISKESLKRALHERRVIEKSAISAARHDALTGLFNRRYLLEKLDRAIETEGENENLTPGLLLLGLDRFKLINDLHGHEAGDQLLQIVASRIKAVCEPGQVAMRLGSDEFAVLICEDNPADAALSLARRICQMLTQPFELEGVCATVSCSTGIVIWENDKTATEMLKNAEQAMCRAKDAGRGTYAIYNQEMGETLRTQAGIEVDLRRAIENQEIKPYFQPIISLSGQELVGFEVLARWHCPKRGIVQPDKFISIAEDCGLISALTWDLMARACKIAKSWDSALSISFNVSTVQFRDDGFAEQVRDLLSDVGFPPERLVLEITESALIEDVACAAEIFKTLAKLGVRLSLDDFGTGYSSLAMLHQLQFDNVKIDRSFVTGVKTGSQSAKIVDGILALAASLDLSVTAEGIENQEELAFLGARHCPQGQGFLFSRPLSRADLDVFLEKVAQTKNTGTRALGAIAS